MALRTRKQGLDLVARLVDKYGPSIEALFPNRASASSLTLGVDNANDSAWSDNTGSSRGITFNKHFLRNASLADLRGNVIHETTHAYGVGAGKNNIETLADYARYKLNPTEVAGWSPSAAVQRYDANHPNQGDNMAGPGSNRTGAGSNKNTTINAQSKAPKPGPIGALGSGVPGPADPSTYGGYASQVMGLQQRLAAAMAAKKVGIAGAQAQYMLAKQQAASGLVQGVTGAEQDALQRGILGSSADLSGRAGAVTDAAAAQQAALAGRNVAVAGEQVTAMGAVGEFYTGLGQAQFDVANAQSSQALQRYQNDLLAQGNQNYTKLQQQWLAYLRSRGRTRDGGPASPYSTGNTPSEVGPGVSSYRPYNAPPQPSKYTYGRV